MADLTPYPFGAFVRRMFEELEGARAVFDLPDRAFVRRSAHDLSVSLHGHRPASPLGPAAGPHTQMAQNLVLAWLGGCRIFELKTVQINDRLEIPRPCIDARTVGFNVEWSQELRLAQSLEEYVKGAMLIHILEQGPVPPAAGFRQLLYDLSVGYDLAGVRSAPVGEFIRGMRDAAPLVDRLRREIPDRFKSLRDLDFPTRLADSVTLSTFHGCPPAEIERIIEFLMREHRLHSIVKFNPMLLGPGATREILNQRLGYVDLTVPDAAFERDTTWDQAVEMMARLGSSAEALGLTLGAKFSNTLIVRNDQGFLPPDEEQAYLSGPPLHVLAMHLVRRFRQTFGDRFPISFSAGVDRFNFPDAVALGLAPITVCTDLLKKGGYGRLRGYYGELERRMAAVDAADIDQFVLSAYGLAGKALDSLDGVDPAERGRCQAALEAGADLRTAAGEPLFARWVAAAKLLNTDHYVDGLASEPRYSYERNSASPRKIGRHLVLFDCLTCDICIPVCPNDANFTVAAPQREIPVVTVEPRADGWSWHWGDPMVLDQSRQIANFADFCNDCGNCDVFCPEDGGPYVIKPRFFGAEESWRRAPYLDGFFVERLRGTDRVLGRFSGAEYALEVDGTLLRFSGAEFALVFDPSRPEETLTGSAAGPVDLTYCFLLDWMRRAVLAGGARTYPGASTSPA